MGPLTLPFEQALSFMKDGHSIARIGWNGKGMFIFIVKTWTFTVGKQDNYPNKNYPSKPFLAMKTATDEIIPWVASQADLLATDWRVVTL